MSRAGAPVSFVIHSSTAPPGAGGGLEVRLRAAPAAYAYLVAVSVPDGDVRFSDNYLELEPGEERTIVLVGPNGAPRAEDVVVRAR